MNAEEVPSTGTSQIIIDPNFTPTWKENLDPEIYHADRTAVNSSSLKEIRKSDFAFKRLFIDGIGKEPTDAMRFGTVAHMALLEGEKFREKYVVMPEFESFDVKGNPSTSKSTKYYKDQVTMWEASLPPGAVVVTQEELDKLMWMLDSFMANADAVKLLSQGKTEVSGYYADPETGILCRIRPDFIAFNLEAMVDVKTVASCDLNWFRKNRVEDDNFSYYFQMSMYDAGTNIITQKAINYPVWILIESVAPFECVVIPMEEVYREIGSLHYREALKKLKNCIDQNKWERRPTLQTMHPSHWFLQKQELVNG